MGLEKTFCMGIGNYTSCFHSWPIKRKPLGEGSSENTLQPAWQCLLLKWLKSVLSSAVFPAPSSNLSYSVILLLQGLWHRTCTLYSSQDRGSLDLPDSPSLCVPALRGVNSGGGLQTSNGRWYLKWHLRKYGILHVLKDQRSKQQVRNQPVRCYFVPEAVNHQIQE